MELRNFVDEELYPKLWESINTIFPEWGFTFAFGKWRSNKRLDGSTSNRKDKTIITQQQHQFILENGSGGADGKRSKDLISFYMELHNKNPKDREERIDTIRELSNKLGLTFPEASNSEEYERLRRKREELSLSHDRQVRALFSPEGAEVLNYLKEKRGYSEDVIREMGIGCLSPSEAEALNRTEKIVVWRAEDYPLSIPYYSGGKIIGFKNRAISEEALLRNGGQKYMNTKGLTKLENPFAIYPNSLSRGTNTKGEIVVVEGELDALHAIALGLTNVIAVSGGDIREETIWNLKKNGYRNIVILLDSDFAGKKFTAESIRRVDRANLNSFVAILPEGKDCDEYLRNHSIDELREVIKEARFGSLYLLAEAVRKFEATSQTDIDFQNFLDSYVDIASKTSDPIKRERLFSHLIELCKGAGKEIDIEAIQKGIKEKVDIIIAEEQQKKNRKKALEALSNAASLLNEGKGVEAIDKAQTALETLRTSEAEEEYRTLLEDNTEELWESYKKSPKALETKFEVYDKEGEKFRISFPSGALSVIGAATGHGKSRVLQSIALDALEDTEEGETLLYVSYEENEPQANRLFLNAYADMNLTKGNNKRTIAEYLRDGSTKYMKGVEGFKKKEEEWKKIRHSGKIKIVKPEDNYLSTLSALLSFAMRHLRVKAIFLDYIQEVYVKDWAKYSRTDELKQAMVTLDGIAQRSGIPIILGAQLRRDVNSPLDLFNQNIADSGWIERKASEIILLWSSTEKCKNDPRGDIARRVKEEIEDKIGSLNLGEKGSIYFRVSKSREILKGSHAVISIDGNTGRVHSNIKPEEPQQKDLFNTPQKPKMKETIIPSIVPQATDRKEEEGLREMTEPTEPEEDILPF